MKDRLSYRAAVSRFTILLGMYVPVLPVYFIVVPACELVLQKQGCPNQYAGRDKRHGHIRQGGSSKAGGPLYIAN